MDLRRVTFFLFQPIYDVQVRKDSKIVIRIGFAIGTEASASHGNNARWIGRGESLYVHDVESRPEEIKVIKFWRRMGHSELSVVAPGDLDGYYRSIEHPFWVAWRAISRRDDPTGIFLVKPKAIMLRCC